MAAKKPAYRFLEHTADIMFEAYGGSYPEALQNAAKAMFSVFGAAGNAPGSPYIEQPDLTFHVRRREGLIELCQLRQREIGRGLVLQR